MEQATPSTPAASFRSFRAGHDVNATNTTIDRLIVRPGQATGGVIESTIDANEGYDGTVVVRLETAPADRFAAVDWTVMESRTSPQEASNGTHSMTWNPRITLQGQLDIRGDRPSDTIDEYNEGNNAIHFVVTGATSISPGLVPSFAPSIGLCCSPACSAACFARRPRD